MRPRRCPLFVLLFSIAVLTISLTFAGCSNDPKVAAKNTTETLLEEKNIVETIVLEKKDFMQEIVSNGKITAIQRADLFFESSGFIEAVHLKNGQQISPEQEIARLQDDEYQFALNKAKLSLEQASIEKLDALIGMGYTQTDTEYTPDHEKIANIRSGYLSAQLQYEEAKRMVENTILLAPFAGKISGITQQKYEKADLSKPFCTLINDTRFYIDFPLLETEISKVKIGQKVKVKPISDVNEVTGTITEINPRIDENGLVWLKAEVKNPGAYLEGMNVKVSIKQAIPNQLVVPKQAVVLRQNKEVLFKYLSGTAYWTYLKVLNENENEYSVMAKEDASLEPGDTIIVSNNLNLAHESEVEIK